MPSRSAGPKPGSSSHGWDGTPGSPRFPILMHRIIDETGAYVRFGRRNPQAIFNIDKLLDTAREFDRRGYTTLQDFVEWVRNIREAEQREATADMNLPGFQGAVSIMTVHKAKGLEFPIVFLPGMNQQPRSVSTGPAGDRGEQHRQAAGWRSRTGTTPCMTSCGKGRAAGDSSGSTSGCSTWQ